MIEPLNFAAHVTSLLRPRQVLLRNLPLLLIQVDHRLPPVPRRIQSLVSAIDAAEHRLEADDPKEYRIAHMGLDGSGIMT